MDMQWLDDVLVLLEEGNMTRAAARRNITQPAFSRRIRCFEDWLGVSVLERKSNSIDLSPALTSNETEIRALVFRLRELRTNIAQFEPQGRTLAISAQHAPVYSTFPDMAQRAKSVFPRLTFRLRAGNLNDCTTMFLRGDTDMLLCYEAQSEHPPQFTADVKRGAWGKDYLIPVVGGALRYQVRDNHQLPTNTPAIVYPENSYFGSVLHRQERAFATAAFSANPVCVTAFSSGVRELVLKGLGIGWVPFSMMYREIESGDVISLANQFGREELEVAIYAKQSTAFAMELLAFWSRDRPSAQGLQDGAAKPIRTSLSLPQNA